jgi:hypothetical protein
MTLPLDRLQKARLTQRASFEGQLSTYRNQVYRFFTPDPDDDSCIRVTGRVKHRDMARFDVSDYEVLIEKEPVVISVCNMCVFHATDRRLDGYFSVVDLEAILYSVKPADQPNVPSVRAPITQPKKRAKKVRAGDDDDDDVGKRLQTTINAIDAAIAQTPDEGEMMLVNTLTGQVEAAVVVDVINNGILTVRRALTGLALVPETAFALNQSLGGGLQKDVEEQRSAAVRARAAPSYAKRQEIASQQQVLELVGNDWVHVGTVDDLVNEIKAHLKTHVAGGGRAADYLLRVINYLRSSEPSEKLGKEKCAAQTSTLGDVSAYLAKHSGVKRFDLVEHSECGSVFTADWSSRPALLNIQRDVEALPLLTGGFGVVATGNVGRLLRMAKDADGLCRFAARLNERGYRLIALASETSARSLVGEIGGRKSAAEVAAASQATSVQHGESTTRHVIFRRVLLHILADGFDVKGAPMLRVWSDGVWDFLAHATTRADGDADSTVFLVARTSPPIGDDEEDVRGLLACQTQIAALTYLARSFLEATKARVVASMFYDKTGVNTATDDGGVPRIDALIDHLKKNPKRRTVEFGEAFDRLCRDWPQAMRLMPFIDCDDLVVATALSPTSVFVAMHNAVESTEELVDLMAPSMAPSSEYLLMVNVYRKLADADPNGIGGVVPLLLELNRRTAVYLQGYFETDLAMFRDTFVHHLNVRARFDRAILGDCASALPIYDRSCKIYVDAFAGNNTSATVLDDVNSVASTTSASSTTTTAAATTAVAITVRVHKTIVLDGAAHDGRTPLQDCRDPLCQSHATVRQGVCAAARALAAEFAEENEENEELQYVGALLDDSCLQPHRCRYCSQVHQRTVLEVCGRRNAALSSVKARRLLDADFFAVARGRTNATALTLTFDLLNMYAAGSEAALSRIREWAAADAIAWIAPPAVEHAGVGLRANLDHLCAEWAEWAAFVGFRLPNNSERTALVLLLETWANTLPLPPPLLVGLVVSPTGAGF